MTARPLPDHPHQDGFASTHWTAVRACGRNDTAALQAREELCRDYWYPVYAYIRRSGQHNNDAEDLTQDFFADILRKAWFVRADQTKGKFRSFLLVSLNNFLRDRSKRKLAMKRGGAYQYVPLDMGGSEARYSQSIAPSVSPAEIYELEWASAIVATALRRLENEYETVEKQAQYDALKVCLTVDASQSYDAIAQALGISPENLKVLVHRLRKRYAAVLREEVARTLAGHDDIEDEMRYMRSVFTAVQS